MTNSPDPGNQPRPVHWRLRTLLLSRVSLTIGVILLTGIAGITWWAWVFVHEQLAPLVEKNLAQSLKRPVELGRVERFSLTGLRFGPSSIPATSTDSDRLVMQAVEVSYNPLRLLLTQKLHLGITAVNPYLYIEQAQDGTWVSSAISTEEESGPVRTEIEVVQVQNADVVLVPSRKVGNTKTSVAFNQVNGTARFYGQENNSQRIVVDFGAQFVKGGNFTIQGETISKPRRTNLQIRGRGLPATDVGLLVPLPLQLQAGQLDSNLTVQLIGSNRPALSGTVDLNSIVAQVAALPRKFTEASGRLRFQNQQIVVEKLKAVYGKIPLQARGNLAIGGNFNLSVRVDPISIATAVETLKFKPPVSVTGQVRADLQLKGALSQPVLSGLVTSTQSSQIDRVEFSSIQARFELAKSILSLKDIQATPAVGGQVVGDGRIRLGTGEVGLNFQVSGVPGDTIARLYGAAPPITVGPVSAKASVFGSAGDFQTIVQWQAPGATYPGSGEVIVADQVILLRDTVLSVAGGTVKAQGRIANGRWQAIAEGSQIQLDRFSKDLRGLLNGRINLSGTLSSFRPAAIRAAGQVEFSQGLSLVRRPLNASIQWDGQKLIVQRATAPGFSANGLVFARLEGAGAPAITDLNLNVQLNDYNLQELPFAVPSALKLAGRADFDGRVTGRPTAANVVGSLQLNRFSLNNVPFESVLRGNLKVAAGQGVDLQVAGVRDRIALSLDQNYRPDTFAIRRDQAVATGRSQGERLLVNVENFPVAVLNLSPGAALGLGTVQGQLSGNFDINLSRSRGSGEITVSRPSIGGITADVFAGAFQYANGVATLTRGELRQGESQYLLTGSFAPGAEPQLRGQLKVAQGKLQDITQALQWFELGDVLRGFEPPTYSRAAEVQPDSVGEPGESLLTQLRRFSEIEALLGQQVAQRESLPLPKLSELEGTFAGEISVVGSLRSGFSSTFDIRGQDWQWGRYKADQVLVAGSFERGVVTLLPLRFQSGDSLIAFTGQLGGATQSGQLRVVNLPIEQLQALVPLPLNVTGKLNATATLAGNLLAPQARGELSLVEGTLNGTAVESARAGFTYSNARLDFGSTVIVRGPEPIQITGSIPYQLPFTFIPPESDQISLSVDVRNEGLALLNLLNRQVNWVDGKGEVKLRVQGTLAQPIATGTAAIENATIRIQALPEPLTNVTGTAQFDRDRILVESLRGQFSQGQVTAQGVLPIFGTLETAPEVDPLFGALDIEPETDPIFGTLDIAPEAEPLTVALDQLALNLKGLYRGGVNGRLRITGNLLSLEIGGNIELTNGQVQLPDESAARAITAERDAESDSEYFSPPQFKNLQLTLGERVLITRQPILNFVATGDLLVNGSLAQLSPRGTIRLQAGQVNLFTTQLTLARGYEHTAQFTPNQGLDPTLDIRLVTSVPEVTRTRIVSPTQSADVADVPATNLGALQTVRIEARVAGRASQLFDNLDLTSSPARTETEILALLGGGFVNTLGRGDSTLALANLAGSALLTQIQSVIGNALGLSEFRLFPTVITSREGRTDSSSSTLGLAAEVGVDITSNISASVLRVLTADQPTQFGLRYRVNDQVLIRGSTDFSGDSRAVVEYEARF